MTPAPENPPARPKKLYISRIRQPDGSWIWDEEARTLCETKRLATINRCMAGISTQVWPEAEARPLIEAERTQPKPTP